jgi:ribosomal protein S18 acetylase RimI-like enzyme
VHSILLSCYFYLVGDLLFGLGELLHISCRSVTCSLLVLHQHMTKMKCLFFILVSYTTMLVIDPIHYTANSFTISISPPSSANDYRQLASLLVSSFDAPQDDNDAISSKIQRLKWDIYDKSLTEEFTYKRYVSTVRRMRGKKYCLLVAKKNDNDDEGVVVDVENDVSSSSLGRSNGVVVGMVEMGMSLCPVDTNITTATIDDELNNNSIDMTPTPLIGVICVAPTHQKEGIGTKLLHKCEEVAREIWKEECICVDVEPDNTRALSLFEMGGYVACLDGDGRSALMRNTTILRRRREEVKPHYLLRKRIRHDVVSDDGNDSDERR